MVEKKKRETISIVPYIVRIFKKNDEIPLRVNDFSQNLFENYNFFEIFHEYLCERKNKAKINENSSSAIRISKFKGSGNNTYIGILEAGRYGKTADIVNIKSGDTIRKGIDDCEYIPLFFRLDVQPRKTESILQLQRYGSQSIKSIFESDLSSFFNEHHKDHSLKIHAFTTKEVLQTTLNNAIKEIHFIAKNAPKDFADAIDKNFYEVLGKFTVSIKIKQEQHAYEIIRKFLSQNYDPKRGIEIMGTVYDETKMNIKQENGKIRKLGLNDQEHGMTFDITNNIEYNSEDGHPTFPSLCRESDEIFDFIKNSIGW